MYGKEDEDEFIKWVTERINNAYVGDTWGLSQRTAYEAVLEKYLNCMENKNNLKG